MVVFFLTRTNRSNLKANKTDLYEVIKSWRSLENSWISHWNVSHDPRNIINDFNHPLFEKYCALFQRIVPSFLPFFFFTSFSRANYDAPWRCSTRRWKRFRGKFLHGARLKLMTPRGVKKAFFFLSRRQGKQGIRVHFIPLSFRKERKEHGNCSTAL